LRKQPVGRSAAACLAISRDGKQLAACGPYGKIQVWDLAPARLAHTFDPQGREPNVVAFAPDGKQLAVGFRNDGRIRFWDLPHGQEVRVLPGHERGVKSLAFPPDGTRLASGGAEGDGSLRLWDLAAGKERALATQRKGPVRTSASVDKDGRL